MKKWIAMILLLTPTPGMSEGPAPAPPTFTLTPEQDAALGDLSQSVDRVRKAFAPASTPTPVIIPEPAPTPNPAPIVTPTPNPTPPGPEPVPPPIVTPTPAPEVRIVDDGDPGFVLGGKKWSRGGYGYGNDHCESNNIKTDVAAWIFSAVPAGTYRIASWWRAEENRQQQARYAIYSNLPPSGKGDPIGQVRIDQRSIAGKSDGTEGWVTLGTYTVPAGTLEVHLSGLGDGYMQADALRLETVPTATPPQRSPTITPDATEPHLSRPKVSAAFIGPSGRTLIMRMTDDADNFVEVSGGSSVTLTPAGGMTLDSGPPIAGSEGNRAPYAVYLLKGPVTRGARLTLDAPAGSLMTALGPLGAVASMPVDTTGIGTPMLPQEPPPGPRKMGIGWNTPDASYYNTIQTYADLTKGSSNWFNGSPTVDPDGFPTATQGETACFVTVSVGCPVDARGYASAPVGRWTVDWIGSGTARLTPGAEPTSVVESGPATTFGIGGHRRTYDVTLKDRSKISPAITMSAIGACRSIRVLPPGVSADSTPLYHPEYLRMLAGSRALRGPDPGVNVQEYGDYASPAQKSHAETPRVRTVALARVEDGSALLPFFTDGRLIVLVTTAVPHGLAEGQTVWLNGLPDLPLASGPLGVNGSWAPIYRVTPTQFCIAYWIGHKDAVNKALTGAGTVSVQTGVGQPPEDQVDLCNAVGAGLWMNVPHTASDACVTQLFTMIGQRLRPGLKVHAELSNEHWNPMFPQWAFYYARGYLASPPTGTSTEYARHAAHVHDLAFAALSALGRGGDLVRVFGTQAVNAGVTSEIVTWCAAHRKGIDEIAVAPYMENGPRAERDDLTVDQVMDLGELWVRAGGSPRQYIDPHYSVLRDAFPGAKVVGYEGGPSYGYIGGTTEGPRTGQSVGWLHHPRQRGILLDFYRQCEEGGMTLFLMYKVSYIINAESKGSLYSAYHRWDMPAGRGDGSDGLFDNRTDPFDLERVISVTGGAVRDWHSGPVPLSPGARR
jgi:hypothetical protein